MAKNDLRHLSRKDLLDIIYQMKQEELQLRDRVAQLEQQLADRTIRMQNAGSIAEAALAVNDIFKAAQAAADDYLASVKAAAPQQK